MRVSQPWAGSNWGGIFTPRIGQEVIVDFIGGDPDCPIITGRVYNAEHMPPWTLPDDKTQSGILTRSSQKGTPDDANMLRFEDKKGEEEIHVHAQKQLTTVVEQDELRTVGGTQDILVKKKKTETIEADNDFHVKGERKQKIDGKTSLTVGGDQHEKVGKNHAMEAGMEIHLKAGMKVVIEAGLQLTLKASGGFVDIGPAGVTIQGTMVLINSGGAAGSGNGSSPSSPNDAKEAK